MSMYNFVTVTRPRRDVIHNEVSGSHTFKQPRVEVNVDDLPTDPGLRPKLCSYHPNDQDKVRRFYLQKGPCQPRTHDFPQRMFGTKSRRFCPSWFNEFESWLEYSINKDASYCLYCYLFKVDYGKQSGGDAFVTTGFSNWSVKGRLRDHVGVPNSAHNIAYRKGEDLMKQIQHIDVAILKQSDQVREIYRRRLSASLTCIRFLLKQGLPFRGHDESDASSNQAKVKEGIAKGEIQTGRGMNQGIGLKRSGETRWGSHYGSLISLVQMYSSVIDVLEVIKEDGVTSDQKGEAMRHLDSIQTFDFAFFLHLMKTVLGITNELSQALQRKDQDILNAMQLVSIAKGRLQDMRDDGWDPLLEEVSAFCKVHDLDIPNMEDKFIPKGRSRRKAKDIKYWEHYRYDLFYTIVDMQLQELNYRFSESNTKLLLCLRCLSPDKSFEAFDKLKLIEFATFYPSDFSSVELVVLENQLETYILDMRSNDEFSELKGIACLAEMLVKTGKHRVYQLVYLLLKLALTLPVATAKVERAFSAMKIVKTELRNRMGDDWMNDCLVPYIESDVFDSIDDELIIQHFQNMQARRGQL
ncbi:unnamed protein product [Cuscuta epithymum]|uniref:TTF-type domain-containing protein n=1 Tax=Cuscuta epithymum TaxID=186058 RepID=A0AAV0E7H2_9ASTE|nr:unnamed protein product [Cuscuta epithymum]